jgi:hypothetical protein
MKQFSVKFLNAKNALQTKIGAVIMTEVLAKFGIEF